MRHLDLFSGIGGFSLAADQVWRGAEHTFCEIDPFCQDVLRKHWPQSKIYRDIKELTLEKEYDILTASPPCQPVSSAGRKKGVEDQRWLWGDTIRMVEETQPVWFVLENVRGLLNVQHEMEYENICAKLEGAGYEIQTFCIPACAVGAYHRRDRLWIIGHSNNHGCNETKNGKSCFEREDCDEERTEENGEPPRPTLAWGYDGQWNQDPLQVASKFSGMADGIPNRVQRIKALGNAIVPQIAFELFNSIKEVGELL